MSIFSLNYFFVCKTKFFRIEAVNALSISIVIGLGSKNADRGDGDIRHLLAPLSTLLPDFARAD